MKEPRPVPPGRRRGSSSAGGLTLPLVSPFQAAAARGGTTTATAAGPPSAALSQRLRSLGLPLAAASGVVLLLFCLFASTTTTTSRSASRGFGSSSERAAALSSNGAAARRFRLPVGVGSRSASSPFSPPLLPPPPLPTLSPDEEAAFEADLVSMLAGDGGQGDEEEEGGGGGGTGEEREKSGGGGATATATTAASSSAAAAAAASDSGVSSSSAASSVVGKRGSSSSELSSQPLRLFSGGEKDSAAAAAAAAAANASSSSSFGTNSTLLGLPPDFDWRLYLAYNPELRASGVPADAASAAAHYLARGREEGRPAARLRVALRYTACTGLINQHYSHIAALSLASVLGTEVVLPPAAQRDSFAHYFSTFADRNEVSWTAAPFETLLDVRGLIETWKRREPGLVLRPPPATAPFPDLTKPATAFPAYVASAAASAASAPGGNAAAAAAALQEAQKEKEKQLLPDPSTVARVGDVYLRNLDMASLVEKVRAAAVGKAVALRRAQALAADAAAAKNGSSAAALPPLPTITVDLPCAFFMLRTSDSLDVVTGVARTLKFAPLLVELADKVSRGVTQAAAAEAAAAEAVARVSALSSTSTSSSTSGLSAAAGASSSSPPQVFLQSTTSFPDLSASSSSSSSSSSSPPSSNATKPSTLPFNGVHLRIESDARDWEEILGGRAALWAGYLAAARAAGFGAGTPLYVASGLLTYGASAEMDKVAAEIVKEKLASSIHYKEQHLTSTDLAALNSEQKAAVDFLVLARSGRFVGLGSSTFSFYLREHRALEGIARNSTVLVDASKIGTDGLFASAGVVV